MDGWMNGWKMRGLVKYIGDIYKIALDSFAQW